MVGEKSHKRGVENTDVLIIKSFEFRSGKPQLIPSLLPREYVKCGEKKRRKKETSRISKRLDPDSLGIRD